MPYRLICPQIERLARLRLSSAGAGFFVLRARIRNFLPKTQVSVRAGIQEHHMANQQQGGQGQGQGQQGQGMGGDKAGQNQQGQGNRKSDDHGGQQKQNQQGQQDQQRQGGQKDNQQNQR